MHTVSQRSQRGAPESISFEEVRKARKSLGVRDREVGKLRVLIAYEESHRVYRDAIARVIKALRPHVEVSIAEFGRLEEEMERLAPHLVVSSRPNTVDPGGTLAWYKLSHDPYKESHVYLDGRYSRSEDPGLEELLSIIDETEELQRSGRPTGDC